MTDWWVDWKLTPRSLQGQKADGLHCLANRRYNRRRPSFESPCEPCTSRCGHAEDAVVVNPWAGSRRALVVGAGAHQELCSRYFQLNRLSLMMSKDRESVDHWQTENSKTNGHRNINCKPTMSIRRKIAWIYASFSVQHHCLYTQMHNAAVQL